MSYNRFFLISCHNRLILRVAIDYVIDCVIVISLNYLLAYTLDMMSPIIEIPANEQIKLAYMKMYNLQDHQYDLLEEFYITFQSPNAYLDARTIRTVFSYCLKIRKGDVTLSEEDISRMIEMIDHDQDGFLSFNELIELLNLALASKHSIKERIEQFVTNRTYFYEEKDQQTVQPNEAACFVSYLFRFYSPNEGALVEAYKEYIKSHRLFELRNVLYYEGRSSQLKTVITCDTQASVLKRAYCQELSLLLGPCLFVKL